MRSDRIAFEPLEGYALAYAPGHETTEGGLVLPKTDMSEAAQPQGGKAYPVRLTIVKVGPGEQLDGGRRRDVVIDPGKTYFFLFPPYSLGGYITLDGTEFVIIQSKFVCGRAL